MKDERRHGSWRFGAWLLWGICVISAGCSKTTCPGEAPIPRELRMTTLPPYVIEPPDILIISTLRVVPKPPYRVEPMDALFVKAPSTLESKSGAINGIYRIEPDGNINLGLDYGRVPISGMTIEEAQQAIKNFLAKILRDPTVDVSLAQSRAMQQIQGDHLVRQDGTIGMGIYGSVYVTGMTLEQARAAIENHLSQYVLKPEINLDVYSYNSKWYYVIQDRAGFGQTVIRFPITGRDTVLDALSNMYGVGFFNSDKHMWLARPNGKDPNSMQIFPINWPALAQGGSPATNYQLMPGDRLYVQSNPLLKANNRINQFLMPIERVLGFTLLGSSAVSTIQGNILSAQSISRGGGGVINTVR